MELMKHCNKCGETKDVTNFSKSSARKDGLQDYCKACNKKNNLKFRTEINPQHHAEWQRNNPDRLCELVKKYRKADKGGAIYSIRNPEGETYIGMTEAYLNVRWLEHRQHYKRAQKGKNLALPKLHESFSKYGIENHTFEVVVELPGIDRQQLRFIETSFIESFQQIGKSLNIRVK
jgi:hypothetical protein